MLASFDNVPERARFLLYEIFNTQTQPKLGLMAEFFQRVDKASNRTPSNRLATYADFRVFLGLSHEQKDGLFEALSRCKGWGHKTAALFIRNLAVIAANPELVDMFWPDIHAVNDERIRLPVDAVINAIFLHLRVHESDHSRRIEGFKDINNYLSIKLECSSREMLIWDDLWFWGFITQRSPPKKPKSSATDSVQTESNEKHRKYGWNTDKYWSIFTAPKDKESIVKIEDLASKFLKITEAPV